MANWDDSNRAFLQALMARGTMTFKQGQKVLAEIFTVKEGQQTSPDEVTQEDYDSYMQATSDKVSLFDYEVRSVLHQVTKERVHAIVNATSDPITQIATTRTQEEMFYVHRLIDAMFETYNKQRKEIMALTSMQALARDITKGKASNRQSLGDSQGVDKGVTNEQAERTLAGLVNEGWLDRSKEGWYTLSPRALMELGLWLETEYNADNAEPEDWQPVKKCAACSGIITVGQRCSHWECNVRFHEICLGAIQQQKCPKCNRTWDGKHFVGQKVITESEEYQKGKRRSGGGAAARRSQAADEEE